MIMGDHSVTTVRELLDQRAAKYGDKTFFISPDTGREISYQQLNQQANRVSNLLTSFGIQKGEKVAILLPNIPDFLFAYFGAMKLGAVAGPINILLKEKEISFVLNNSESYVLFTGKEFLPYIEAIEVECPLLREIVVVDWDGNDPLETTISIPTHSMEKVLRLMSDTLEGLDVSPKDEAMIIYTSGTTGNPKGVLLTHENLIINASHIVSSHRFDDNTRALCILPLFHVNGEVVTVISPLYFGGSVVIPQKFSASRFWETIAKYKVNFFSAVPTNLSILLHTNTDTSQLDLSSLKFCICGAAPLPVEVQKAFEKKFGIYIIEGYGLSETTCYSSFNHHPPKGQEALGEGNRYRRFSSIGVAFGNEMKIFDNNDQELPPGERGEIVIRGRNVMKGYFKRPEATEEAFKSGWFHTGDIGYMDQDGYFYITDRKKDMIIRGGENIYPREIDEVLYEHPKVRDAATVGVPHDKYGEDVRSFIVLKEGQTATEQELLDYCQERLAFYKCPKEITFIDEIPKGPSGKLLRRKLIEMYVGI
jgi:long-chain acyl-CoA synthetase